MRTVPLRIPPDPAPLRSATADPAGLHRPGPLPEAQSDFGRDFLAALADRPYRISPKYFYDAEGSRLFDRICELPEYYPTRTELAILGRHAEEIAARMAPHAQLIEFGAGSLQKAALLLRAMCKPARFMPIDISGEHLQAAANALRLALALDQPQLQIEPVVADYSIALPLAATSGGPRYGFFPGSTIGNFTPEEALRFLRRAAAQLRGGALLLGADLIKEPAVLHAAYNDAQGVTAAFNRNLLARANRQLDADFVLERFAHCAFYNAPLQRIEMHLMATQRQRVHLCGHAFTLQEGDTLHTENSYKFTVDGLHALAQEAGFRPGPVWTDEQRRFGVFWLDAPRDAAPAALPAPRRRL